MEELRELIPYIPLLIPVVLVQLVLMEAGSTG